LCGNAAIIENVHVYIDSVLKRNLAAVSSVCGEQPWWGERFLCVLCGKSLAGSLLASRKASTHLGTGGTKISALNL
jgi:hypothetical protein